MRIVGVITARMTSQRLPGKVMKPLAGKAVFAHHVERMRAVEGLHSVYLATSAGAENKTLIAEARSLGVGVHAGAAEDVLARHIAIAEIEHADAVLRVTGDCPVFSIEAATELVEGFDDEDFIYVSNMTMIQGTLSELISTQALLRSHEHYHGPAITQYIRENPELFRLRSITIAEHLCRPEYRLTLDYPIDLKLFEFIYTNLYQGQPIALAEVYKLLDDNPEVARLNAGAKIKNVNLYGARLLTRSVELREMEIRLRALEERDLPQLRDWRNDDRLRHTFREYRLLSMTNQHDWFDHVSSSRQVEMFGIELDTRLIGVCGLCYIDWVNRSAEVSIYLGPDQEDQESALEVMKLLQQKAFDEFNLHRLWSEVYEFNTTNLMLFQKCNFVLEGRLREHVFKLGKYHDSLRFGLLRGAAE